ncbi:MAG: hypothetical protein Q8L88_02430 [Bacteroidota bacterium]|nr:hypothetical protein [Bacteroidota bacterium]
MKKFQATIIAELQIGDRFYFLNDKYKKSQEVLKFFPGKTDRAEIQQILGHKQVVNASRDVAFLNTRAERAAEKK